MEIGYKDNVYNKIKNEIIRKQVLLKEEETDIKIKTKENEFLETVLSDYNKYNHYIKGEKIKQYNALFEISQYLDKLMEQSYISKTRLEEIRFDKDKILQKINSVRLELDEIIDNKNIV